MANKKTTPKSDSKKKSKSNNKTPNTKKTGVKTGDFIVDNTTFELTIPQEEVEKGWQKALEQAQEQLKQDGFRKGKAPLSMVKNKLGQGYLVQKTAEVVLPEAYSTYVKEHDLKPLTEPDIHPKSVEEGQAWTFEVAIPERPEIKLGDWQKIAKKAKSEWEKKQAKNEKTKDQKDSGPKNPEDDSPVQAMVEALLEKIEVKVPELLLRRETENQLHQLEHQLEHMGMTMPDFLDKSGQSSEDIQRDYAARSLGSLRVELLLGEIIAEEKVTVSEEEITTALKQRVERYPEDQRPQISAQDIQYMHSVLLKQKALDHLRNL